MCINSRHLAILAILSLGIGGCSMNRCKTVVDPNPPKVESAESEAAVDSESSPDSTKASNPWATPSHNPSMTQLPNKVSSSIKKPEVPPETPPKTSGTQLPPPTAILPGDVEVQPDKNAPVVRIFKYDGSRQCGQGKPLSLEEMAKDLKGITILSQENKNDGMMRIQMCGAPTGNANIYVIYQKDMKKAFRKGFREWKPEAN